MKIFFKININFLVPILGIAIWTSCQKETVEYPLGLMVYGPYDESIYLDSESPFKLKRPIDFNEKSFFDGGDVFYFLEVSNHSKEPVLIAKSNGGGNFIWCRYFCFWCFKNRHLVPGGGVLGVDDIQIWDTLFPNTTKQYTTWFDFEILDKCNIINLSIEAKSPFFDSLNANKPIRYFWDSATPIELKHPVFFFNIEGERFFPSASQNIQKKLDRSKKKLKIDR